MIRFFEERFLMSNILEVGKILMIGDGYFEDYCMASKGLSTVCLNIKRVLNHFIVAKSLKRSASIDLYSLNLGGFAFPYEFFDYATFLNGSFELIPYRVNRTDILKFVNRFLKNGAFLSISLYNPYNEENKKLFEKGELISTPSEIEKSDESCISEPALDKNDYFYRIGEAEELNFRHIFYEDDFIKDLNETGFEIVEFTDDEHIIKGKPSKIKHMEELTGKYTIVSLRKVDAIMVSKEIQ